MEGFVGMFLRGALTENCSLQEVWKEAYDKRSPTGKQEEQS